MPSDSGFWRDDQQCSLAWLIDPNKRAPLAARQTYSVHLRCCQTSGWRIVISPDPNIVTFRRKPRGLRWWSPILKAFVPDSIFGSDELSPESGHP